MMGLGFVPVVEGWNYRSASIALQMFSLISIERSGWPFVVERRAHRDVKAVRSIAVMPRRWDPSPFLVLPRLALSYLFWILE